MKIFVTGASGFIGRALTRALIARGDQVLALSRSGRADGGAQAILGDPTTAGDWGQQLAGCDAVIHLAGEPIAAQRWTAAQKHKIEQSRIDGTNQVVAAITAAPKHQQPRVLLCSSGVDYYRFDDSDTPYTETSPAGDSFLAGVCKKWEELAARAPVRVVSLRTGIVLGRGEGALPKMITPFKLFAGGPIGSGAQWFPWVHVDDVVGAFLHALDHDSIHGAVNAVAEDIVREKDFARALGKALGRPSWLPVPGAAVHLAVGELADYLLHGRKVVPKVLEDSHYNFVRPNLADALAASV